MSGRDSFNSSYRWASRLAFPLLAGAVLWGYAGYHGDSRLPPWACYALSAAFAFGGAVALRARHARRPSE